MSSPGGLNPARVNDSIIKDTIRGRTILADEEKKISCHVCKKEIPKAAALNAEGEEYVYYFCQTECLDYWNEKKDKNDKK
jgi:NAD-dependent dihydropyrimidine dehydrogenase PreA subunit